MYSNVPNSLTGLSSTSKFFYPFFYFRKIKRTKLAAKFLRKGQEYENYPRLHTKSNYFEFQISKRRCGDFLCKKWKIFEEKFVSARFATD